jgi:hypothetical protein
MHEIEKQRVREFLLKSGLYPQFRPNFIGNLE